MVVGIYALMTRMTREAYVDLFSAVHSFMPNLQCIMTDFEAAVAPGIQQVYGNTVAHHGCFFHYSQVNFVFLID